MSKYLSFAACFLLMTVAHGQTSSAAWEPPKYSGVSIDAWWECEHGGDQYGHETGTGVDLQAAIADADTRLAATYPGLVCPDGSENLVIRSNTVDNYVAPKKKFGDPYPAEGEDSHVPGKTVRRPCPCWLVELTYDYGNGETGISVQGCGDSYCAAYARAWQSVRALASLKNGVCCCSGRCKVLQRPCQPACCQPACGHAPMRRMRGLRRR